MSIFVTLSPRVFGAKISSPSLHEILESDIQTLEGVRARNRCKGYILAAAVAEFARRPWVQEKCSCHGRGVLGHLCEPFFVVGHLAT